MVQNKDFAFSMITEKASLYNISVDEIESYLITDLSAPGRYGSTSVLLLKDSVCVIGDDNSFFRKKLSEIKDITAEIYTSSGELIIHTDNDSISIAHFTLTTSAKVERFVSCALKTINLDSNVDFTESAESTSDSGYINKGRKKLFLRVLSYVPKYKKHLAMIIGIILTTVFVNLISPYLTGTILYDEVLSESGKYHGEILALVLILIGITLLNTLLGIILGRIGAEMSGKIIYDIKTEVFSSMQKLGMKFFSSKRTGNLLNRINSDALDIQYFLNDGLPYFLIHGVTIASVGLFLFIVNPLLSVSVIIPVPLIALIIKNSTRRFKKLKWHSWRRSSSLNSIINDNLQGVRVVKSFGKEDFEIERFNHISKALCDNRVREGIAAAKVFPLLSWVMSIGGLIVWGVGGGQILSGNLSFGELMSFIGYLSLLYNPVNFMVKTFDWWTNCMNSAQRIFEVIDRKPDIIEAENPVCIGRLKGDIEFRNVTFSYEPNKTVLKNVSFNVKSGEMIGLVGHSGAGKSTITNILTRLYDVNDGEVFIDGINIKNISLKSLHKNIGIVLQNTFLFSGTIAENISYGRNDATAEEIIDAAKKAHAHEFILKLPDGYDTYIGKDGIDLSGGEKQRISIARAILMDPAILIFDEATASLDTETEQKIQEAMNLLMENRTTIAIAHRFSTLKNADRLVVVEHGKIVESGSHDELFNKTDGVYSKMAHMQLDALVKGKEDIDE